MCPTSIAVWKPERAAAVRTGVALPRLADVGELRLVVPARLHAAQVAAGLVGAGDELPLAQALVRHDLDGHAHRPDRAGSAPRLDLLVRRRTDQSAEHGRKLGFVEPVVAADEAQDDTSVGHHRHRLRRGGGIDAEQLGEADRVVPGVDELGLVKRRRNSGARGMPCAISMSAA